MAKQFQVDTGGTLTSGLQAYYKLEDVSDYFGTNTLTNTNSVAFNAGKVNNGADTGSSNTNKSLTVANALGINGGTVTIAFWIKLATTIGSITTFLGQESNGSSNTGYEFEYDGTTLTFNRFKNGTSDNNATETVSLSSGTWYFIVGTYDGSTLQLYRNNVAKGSLTTSGNGGAATTQNFTLFHNPTAAVRYFSGIIDEVGVWNRALTTTEMTDLWNGGSGQTMSISQTITASATGVVSLAKSYTAIRSIVASATAVVSLSRVRSLIRSISVTATGSATITRAATYIRTITATATGAVSVVTKTIHGWILEIKTSLSWILDSRADERLWDDTITTWDDPVATWSSPFTSFGNESKNLTSFTYESKNT